ncbi:MAG: DUF4097 family beta strand repeat-containing protein [Bryobacteraceae bacterium]
MRMILKTAVAALSLISLAGAAQVHEDFHSTYPLSQGGTISIENQNGSIEISSWNNNSVEITGAKFAKTQEDLNRIQIEIHAAPDAISIRTVIPRDSHINGGARYVLHVPRQVNLNKIASSNGAIRIGQTVGIVNARTSNGSIDIDPHEGNVEADTSNGRIRVDLSGGLLTANTSNGPIEAHVRNPAASPLGLATSNGPITLSLDAGALPAIHASSSNGPIDLHIPANANAQIHAATSNSGIYSDFAFASNAAAMSSGRHSMNVANGTIGSGGPSLTLTTSNGPIRIVKD